MSLKALFEPRSVAVIGASSNPARIGGRPLDYYLKAGFKGRIYPVNPKRTEIQGLKAYPNITSIPDQVDLAVLAISANLVAEALTACGEKGVKAVVLFSAGFSEQGEAGDLLQVQLDHIVQSYGMRILGPNCLGLYNGDTGNCPTFTSGLEGGFPINGRVGLITQSGAYGTHLLTMAKTRRLGVSKWVSTGNESDLTVAECLEYLIDSETVDVVGCYMEGVKKPKVLIRALEKARAKGKAIVIMKVGVSEVGSKAVQSHTASLTGSDASFQALIDQYGAQRAKTTEKMFDILYAFSISPLANGNKLGILTVSGGAGVLMADAAEEVGLPVPPMPIEAQKKLIARNPLCAPRNPIDVTGSALNDFSLVGESLAAMCEEGHYDLLVAFFTSWVGSPAHGDKLFDALDTGMKTHKKPFAVIGQSSESIKEKYESAGMMFFEDPSRAIAALSALAKFNTAFQTVNEDQSVLPSIPTTEWPAGKISEAQAKRLIQQAGIPVLKEKVASTAEEAVLCAKELGFPVAIKIVSADIAHKSEAGGVALDLLNEQSVRTAAHSMFKTVAEREPTANIEGLLVSPMIKEGVDFIVGTQQDPTIGPIIMVGLGGIYTEVLKDLSLSLAPVTPNKALSMLTSLRGAGIFQGARGQAVINIQAVAEVVSRLSVLAVQKTETVASIEINPLRAMADKVVALDALVLRMDEARHY